MPDVHNKATRSFNMSRIKGKNTKPEMIGDGSFCLPMDKYFSKQHMLGNFVLLLLHKLCLNSST